MFEAFQMVLWLIISPLADFAPQKIEASKRYNDFLLLKENVLSIQSVFLSFYMLQYANTKTFPHFFIEYIIKVVRKVSSTNHTI